MRHDKRIDPFLDYLREQWHNAPDYRFGQLLSNLGINVGWNAEERDQPIPHEWMRKIQHWGTYGKDGDEDFKQIPICDLTDEHLKAILDTQKGMDERVKEILEEEVQHRIGRK